MIYVYEFKNNSREAKPLFNQEQGLFFNKLEAIPVQKIEAGNLKKMSNRSS